VNTKQGILELLRRTAPGWTWVVYPAEITIQYMTTEYPWGRKVQGFRVAYPRCKVAGYLSRCRVYSGAAFDAMRQTQRDEREATLPALRSIGGGVTNDGFWASVPAVGGALDKTEKGARE
jgi:hypothetical protein